ncbi:MAG: DUF2846 domain-containing protein [Alphaproteobacteria bacterium]|nr:DUF2846 domain-containing protein [Alphaproteobacteria bacterium]MBV9695033.1 DUF2846 domain-containing protein [Alphaproteobacteria bacterium]
MVRSILILLFCAPLLSGCAAGFIAMQTIKSTGKFESAPPPPNGKALLYVYRTASMTGAVNGAEIYADGKKLFGLATGGYAYAYLPPGQHRITAHWSGSLGFSDQPVELSLDLATGTSRFVRFSAATEPDFGFNRHTWKIEELAPPTAMSELNEEHLDRDAVAELAPEFRP